MQLVICGFCLLTYYFLSDNVASLLNDPALTGPIRLASFVVLTHGMYVVLAKGYLNGRKMFKQQSYIEAANSFFKVLCAFLMVLLGYGLFGIITAYIVAPLIAFMIILKYMKKKSPKIIVKYSTLASLVKFALPVTLFYATITLTMELGLLMVKSLLAGDHLTGIYTSASSLSKVTLTVFSALPFTMLPSISSATAAGDSQLVKKYINQSMRYATMVLLPIAVLISAYAKQIIVLLYSQAYVAAAPVLSILIFGFVFFALFMALCAALFGANKPGIAMIASFILLPLSFVLNVKLIPLISIQGAALATLLTGFVGLVLVSAYTLVKFNTLVNFFSVAKIVGASSIIYFLAVTFNSQSGLFIIMIFLLLLLYLFLLYLFGEIKNKELQMLRSLLSRGQD